jgi:predicted ABC-type exoprotein transport system permease subunit
MEVARVYISSDSDDFCLVDAWFLSYCLLWFCVSEMALVLIMAAPLYVTHDQFFLSFFFCLLLELSLCSFCVVGKKTGVEHKPKQSGSNSTMPGS